MFLSLYFLWRLEQIVQKEIDQENHADLKQ